MEKREININMTINANITINVVSPKKAKTDVSRGFMPGDRCETAKQMLLSMFRAKREWPSAEFWANAKANKVSRNAVIEALGQFSSRPAVWKTKQKDGTNGWVWSVPTDWLELGEANEAKSSAQDHRKNHFLEN